MWNTENGFGVQYVTSIWRIKMITTSPLAARGGTRGIEGAGKRLRTRSPLLSWRRGKNQVISWTKRIRNNLILEIRATPLRWRIFFLKKRKNSGGVTKTPSADGVTNGSNKKTALVNSLPPKRNLQTCDGIFFDYMNISFQVNLSACIQYASIAGGYIYKVGCVGEFVTFFANSCLCYGVQCQSWSGTIHSWHNCSHIM